MHVRRLAPILLAGCLLAATTALSGCSSPEARPTAAETRPGYTLEALRERLMLIASISPDSSGRQLVASYDPWLSGVLSTQASDGATRSVDEIREAGAEELEAIFTEIRSVVPSGTAGKVEEYVVTEVEPLAETFVPVTGTTRGTPFEGMELYRFEVGLISRFTTVYPGGTDEKGRAFFGLFGAHVAKSSDRWYLICATRPSLPGPRTPKGIDIAARIERDR